MTPYELYPKGHLVVAAIRVLEHQKNSPPSIAEVCDILQYSEEQGTFLCRKLHARGIIESVESTYGNKLFIRDHQALESLPTEKQSASMAEEVEKFQQSRKNISNEVETFKQKQAQKQKELFSKLEKKLKDPFQEN